MRTASAEITTDSSGAGTALLSYPITGEVLQILAGTALGTASLTVTRSSDGYQMYSGGVAGTVFGRGGNTDPEQPVDGYLKFTVVDGGDTVTDKIRVYYESE